ncbi:MAG: protein translocase subunit SecD [Bdellovibrionales bacterium]|nr:protein translocase subunit SecD [Bdellovibrionales bacterium]
MTKAWWAKLVVLTFFIGMAGVYVYPTLSNMDVEKSKFPFKQKINLGLDLQGGLYLVLGVDFNKVFKDVVSRQVTSLRDGLKDKGITPKRVEFLKESAVEDPRLILEFDPAKRTELYDLIKKSYWTLRLAAEKPGVFELGLSTEYRAEVRDTTINQSIEVIRNRIDEFGVAEPVISSQGSDRVVVELPGVKDIDRAKDLIGRTAKLEFRIVNTKAMDPGKVAELVASIEKEHGISYKEGSKFSDYVRLINEKAKGKIPADSEIAFEKISSMEKLARARSGETPAKAKDKDAGATYTPYLLFSRADVTGDDLEDAQVSFNQEDRMPNVSFSLNPRGAETFGKLTTEHVNDFLAIVLDNIVHSAPRINGPIPGGRGQITLGAGNQEDVLREAKDLAIVLRAGALPAQLEFLEQRVVGPSLGQDSIQKGAKAGIVGILAIFIFMIFYYRGSGMVAAFSLLLNALFIFAILVGIEATLTLPGIAGIALTIGMAVDSNVIIFERIRDELSEGKSVLAAVEAGFGKAFSAIFDANITHGIIAVILMTYGTGPIRGFAMSLLIGIFTTLFCAVTVAKLIFDGYLSAKPDLKKLSI